MSNGMNRLLLALAALAVIAAVAAAAWLYYKVKDDTLTLGISQQVDTTPTIVERMRSIGQWEFLAIKDEEIIDTVRTGFFSDDELVRIYYGTLRLGIDLRACSEEWIRTEDDTVYVTVPEITLLDYNFIDEAQTRSFFETGKWTNADRKAMYEKARRQMLARCMTKENTDIAMANARDQISRMLKPIVEPRQLKIEN